MKEKLSDAVLMGNAHCLYFTSCFPRGWGRGSGLPPQVGIFSSGKRLELASLKSPLSWSLLQTGSNPAAYEESREDGCWSPPRVGQSLLNAWRLSWLTDWETAPLVAFRVAMKLHILVVMVEVYAEQDHSFTFCLEIQRREEGTVISRSLECTYSRPKLSHSTETNMSRE